MRGSFRNMYSQQGLLAFLAIATSAGESVLGFADFSKNVIFSEYLSFQTKLKDIRKKKDSRIKSFILAYFHCHEAFYCH